MISIPEHGHIKEKSMRNNLINKIIIAFACAFVVIFANTKSGFAEDLPDQAITNSEGVAVDISDELLDLDDADAEDKAEAIIVEENYDNAGNAPLPENQDIVPDTAETSPDIASQTNEADIDFLNNEAPEDNKNYLTDNSSGSETPEAKAETTDTSAENTAQVPSPLLDVQPFPDDDSLDSLEIDANKAQIDSTADVDDVIPEIGDSKSPFESFGNAILSKVDNDLFNQMSNIEKQTTLLRLELRREELKSRVEALRNARIRAQQEEDERARAEAQRAKDVEAERQAMIIAEQEKLKQKEIELEKVKQAKMVNDYMNEMLLTNQKWVTQTAELQKRIHDLEEEKQAMSTDFSEKLSKIQSESNALATRAEAVVGVYKKKMEALNTHINQLQSTMAEREDEIKQLSNPFSGDGTPGEDAIDMSRDYAIMDITGKGDDVVAKILSNDGKTFIIHKGSKLKNGEVVTSITDHYISFENNGVQSYLYTGGTVMEYEPMATFNGADKTPVQTEKQTIKGDTANAFGKADEKKEPVLIKHPKKTSGNLSFGSGTFVQ